MATTKAKRQYTHTARPSAEGLLRQVEADNVALIDEVVWLRSLAAFALAEADTLRVAERILLGTVSRQHEEQYRQRWADQFAG